MPRSQKSSEKFALMNASIRHASPRFGGAFAKLGVKVGFTKSGKQNQGRASDRDINPCRDVKRCIRPSHVRNGSKAPRRVNGSWHHLQMLLVPKAVLTNVRSPMNFSFSFLNGLATTSTSSFPLCWPAAWFVAWFVSSSGLGRTLTVSCSLCLSGTPFISLVRRLRSSVGLNPVSLCSNKRTPQEVPTIFVDPWLSRRSYLHRIHHCAMEANAWAYLNQFLQPRFCSLPRTPATKQDAQISPAIGAVRECFGAIVTIFVSFHCVLLSREKDVAHRHVPMDQSGPNGRVGMAFRPYSVHPPVLLPTPQNIIWQEPPQKTQNSSRCFAQCRSFFLYTGGLTVLQRRNTHRIFSYQLAKMANCVFCCAEYRRAPDVVWPAQMEDVLYVIISTFSFAYHCSRQNGK